MIRPRKLDRLFARFCRTGDPEALGAVFDGTAGELLHIAVWLCGNRADAEDLLQRTFVQAIELRGTFEHGRPVLPWLIGLLGNLARHLQRDRARVLPPREGTPARDPAAAAEDAEFVASVRARVAAIEPPYREVLVLHLEQGLNAKEIAARLGRPAGTVRTQLVRALERLRKRLPAGFVAGLVPAVPDAAALAHVKAAVLAKTQVVTTAAVAGSAVAIVTGGILMASKLVFVVPAAVVLLGAGVWFANVAGSVPAAAGAPLPPAAPAVASAAGDRTEAAAPAARSPAAAPTAMPADSEPAPIPADATWVEVQVADKTSGAPVAAAEVAWMDSSTQQHLPAPAVGDRMPMYRNSEPVARRYGWRARTDERGVVRVHLSDWTGVFARAGTRYGFLQCDKATPSPGGYRIELAEDRNLQVQVLDAVGRPAAGVFVAVAKHRADGAFLRLWNSGLARTEEPDGKVRIAHMQDWVERPEGGEVLVPAAHWRVRVEMPGSKDPGVEFDPNAPPAATVVLRLPATGRITARIELAGGRVLTRSRSETHIGLHVGSPDDVMAQNHAWQQPIGPDGCARFPWISVGGRFVAFTRLTSATLVQEFAGPTAAGEDVTVVLTPSPDDVALTGRILDAQQQLVRNTELWVEFKAVRREGSTTLQTDSDGRFLMFFGPARGLRLESFAVHRLSSDGPTLRGTIPPRGLDPGVHDVGDLVLQAGLLVAAGHFMEGERPYTGNVQFTVERKQIGGDRYPRDRWEAVPNLTTTQAPPGTFEVRGDTGPGRSRLTFNGAFLPVEPIEFVPGARDLTVQIVRGASLVATVLLPRDLPWGVHGVLKPDRPGAESVKKDDPFQDSRLDCLRVEATDARSERRALRWQALPPASYSLELRLWGVAEPVLSIPGVNVPLPEGDHRLEDIDLRAKVAVLTVRTLDPEGKPLPSTARNAYLFVQPLDPAADWFGHQLVNGAVRIPVPSGPVDLLVVVGGFRPQEVRGARGEVQVTLAAWRKIELIFPDLPELPDGYFLQAMLQGAGDGNRAHYMAKSEWASNSGPRESLLQPRATNAKVQKGRVELPIGEGPQRLSVHLYGGSGRGRVLTGMTPLEVSAGAGPIEVRIPAEVLEKALAEEKVRTGR